MKHYYFIILLCIFALSCNREKVIVDPGPVDIIIKNGASFGECIGYCWREITINSISVIFTESGWMESETYPTITISGKISESEWQMLTQSIDFETINAMRDTYGCPDCVDQGSEWVEIIRGKFSKKITFEFGESLPEIQQLLDQVRDIRIRFENQSPSMQ